MFKFFPEEFIPGFNVKEEEDVPGFNVRQEDAYPWIKVGPEDAFAVPRETSNLENDPNVVPTAWGDLKCDMCGAGKQSGTTGAFDFANRAYCYFCAIKELRQQGVPDSKIPEELEKRQLERAPKPPGPQSVPPQAPQPEPQKPQSPQPRPPLPRTLPRRR